VFYPLNYESSFLSWGRGESPLAKMLLDLWS
jgi:hypothetical protein